MRAYYADDHVELYHGDMREILPVLDARAVAVVTDLPYGETSLAWDRWRGTAGRTAGSRRSTA